MQLLDCIIEILITLQQVIMLFIKQLQILITLIVIVNMKLVMKFSFALSGERLLRRSLISSEEAEVRWIEALSGSHVGQNNTPSYSVSIVFTSPSRVFISLVLT